MKVKPPGGKPTPRRGKWAPHAPRVGDKYDGPRESCEELPSPKQQALLRESINSQ